ncbi:lanthionine synthetase C family protein [Clostridium cellulovorans]|uniref:Lanthionine synthetase C family protein n=1 Tax=Clostridium cellulovorans (strain ATCC 35296 / DSM 3052 / OCM 3 / 743B) TaxID=573061 RepID=D9SNC5_CLOC7|nr:lanthionine synthetase C family protein [Clostridium cellulovorans]ADL53917.1 Lanthionine synthetase C family protein [Clostridium cellulovorans 743B]
MKVLLRDEQKLKIEEIVKSLDVFYKDPNNILEAYRYVLKSDDLEAEIKKISPRYVIDIARFLGELYSSDLGLVKDQIKQNFHSMNKNLSSFHGLSVSSGIALIINSYKDIIGIDEDIDEEIFELLKIMVSSIEKYIITIKDNKIMRYCECIGGLVGIGRVLLRFKDNAEIDKTIRLILKTLIDFVYMNKVYNGVERPSWYITDKEEFVLDRERFPNGYLNNGMAHGISGVLAFLSISIIRGIKVEGQSDAIEIILKELYKYKIENDNVTYWLGRIPYEMIDKFEEIPLERCSWCYGTIGISRAIYLAGKAIKKQKYIDDALYSLKTISKLSIEDMQLTSPMFCHGTAGVLEIFTLMYDDTLDEDFLDIISKLIDETLKYFDEEEPFKFYTREISSMSEKYPMDDYTVFGGVISVALVLLQFIKKKSTEWESVFVIN